jgi:membrane fusion protein, multidrug efflux system
MRIEILARWTAAVALLGSIIIVYANRGAVPASASEPKAAEVGVITVQVQPRVIVHELPGRIASMRVADVRPRVSGIIMERLFRQGSDVKVGDPLYQIDRRPFEIEVEANEAAVAKAEAALHLVRLRAHRVATLAAKHIASEEENDSAEAAMREAEADLAARRADLDRAKLNYDYATIRAPINGRIDAAVVSEGALVTKEDTTSLAMIQQLDPIYADFTQSVSDLNSLRRAFESGDLERVAPDAAKVRLIFEDGSSYALNGKLLFSGARVDASTGKVTLRGEFPNPQHELLPGMYVRVQIEQGRDSDAIAVPQQAVQRDRKGDSAVFVLNKDNQVSLHPIRTGALQDGQWIVLEGLKPGDLVVVDGFQKFASGDHVAPRPWLAENTEATDDSEKIVRQ